MKTDRLPTRILLGYAVLTLIGMLVCSAALLFCYDADPGYFRNGALSVLFAVVAGVALLAAPLVLWLTRKQPADNFAVRGLLDPMPHTAQIASYLAVAALLANAVRQAWGWRASGTRYPALVLVGAVLALLGCLALIPGCGRWRAIGIPSLVLWGGCGIITHYFDWYVPMNSPLKEMQLTSLLVMMLFVLNHAFSFAGAPRPRRILLTDCYLLFFGGCGGVALLAMWAAGRPLPGGYLVEATVPLFLGLSALFRLPLPPLPPVVHSSEPSEGELS